MTKYRLLATASAVAAVSNIRPAIELAEVHKLKSDMIIDIDTLSKKDGKTVLAAVNSLLENVYGDSSYVAVAGSVYPIDINGRLFRLAVKRHTISLPYNDESLKGKHVINANVFKDETDNKLWKAVGEGDNRRLVLISEEDQTDVLKRLYNPNLRVAVASIIEKTFFMQGDCVAFYNEEKAEVDFGLAAAYDNENDKVSVITAADVVEVPSIAVLASTPAADPSSKIVTAGAADALQMYVNYLRSYYGGDNPLIKGYTDLLKTHNLG